MQQAHGNKRAHPRSSFTRKMSEKGYVTVAAAAKKAKVARSTVYRWTVEGGLPVKMIEGAIFIKVLDLTAFLVRRNAAKTWRTKAPPRTKKRG